MRHSGYISGKLLLVLILTLLIVMFLLSSAHTNIHSKNFSSLPKGAVIIEQSNNYIFFKYKEHTLLQFYDGQRIAIVHLCHGDK